MSSQKSPSKSNSTLEKIVKINKECFTSDDYYSSIENIKGYPYLTVKLDGELVGYIIYNEYEGHLESLRRALTAKARGKGLGIKLTKKLITIANKKGKSVYTYVSKTNLPSLNSNLKCGYRIEDISEDWVYIRYKGKKNAKKA